LILEQTAAQVCTWLPRPFYSFVLWRTNTVLYAGQSTWTAASPKQDEEPFLLQRWYPPSISSPRRVRLSSTPSECLLAPVPKGSPSPLPPIDALHKLRRLIKGGEHSKDCIGQSAHVCWALLQRNILISLAAVIGADGRSGGHALAGERPTSAATMLRSSSVQVRAASPGGTCAQDTILPRQVLFQRSTFSSYGPCRLNLDSSPYISDMYRDT